MMSRPAPPSSSGHGTPRSPSSPIFFTFSHGNADSASSCAATGATSSRANCRTISRVAWCCSVKYSVSSILWVFSLGCLGLARGADDGEKALAVTIQLRWPHSTNPGERLRRSRPPHRHFGERPVGEHDISRHVLLLGDAPPQRAQLIEERHVARSDRHLLGSGGAVASRARGRTRSVARGLDMRAKAIVTPSALRAGGRIAEVTEHESATAHTEVGVLLHCLQLGEIRASPAVQRLPIDTKATERLPWFAEERAATQSLPLDELACLQSVEQCRCSECAAKAGRKPCEDDGCALFP